MTFDIDKFKEIAKKLLTPEQYQKWSDAIEEPDPKDHPCFVEEFFHKEEEKPVELRQKFCMISCNCYKCLPYHM